MCTTFHSQLSGYIGLQSLYTVYNHLLYEYKVTSFLYHLILISALLTLFCIICILFTVHRNSFTCIQSFLVCISEDCCVATRLESDSLQSLPILYLYEAATHCVLYVLYKRYMMMFNVLGGWQQHIYIMTTHYYNVHFVNVVYYHCHDILQDMICLQEQCHKLTNSACLGQILKHY